MARRMPASSAISWEEYGALTYLCERSTSRHAPARPATTAIGNFQRLESRDMSRIEMSVVLSGGEILQI